MDEKDAKAKGDSVEMTGHQPYRVSLPGFVTEEDIGLGDVVKRLTYAVGIKTCGGCERRAATLNRWAVFGGRRAK